MMDIYLSCWSEIGTIRTHSPNPINQLSKVVIRILVLSVLYGWSLSQLLEPFGYINIDCGGQSGNYKDPLTGLDWVTDEGFLQSADLLTRQGLAAPVEVLLNDSRSTSRINANQLKTAMAFVPPVDNKPIHKSKYCYKFNLSLSNRESRNYLLRAVFPKARISSIAGHEYIIDIIKQQLRMQNTLYNTDDVIFDAAVDATTVFTVSWNWNNVLYESQILELFVTSLDDSMYFCVDVLSSLPFAAISSLELRSLPEKLFPTFTNGKFDSAGRAHWQATRGFTYFITISRLNFGGNDSSPALRFPSDRYDRLWYGTGTPVAMNSNISLDYGVAGLVAPMTINTASEVESKSIDPNAVFSRQLQDDLFQVPPLVWSSAWEAINFDSVISFTTNLNLQGFQLVLQRINSFTLNFVLFDVDPDGESSISSRSVDIYNAVLFMILKEPEVYAGEWLAQAVDVPTAERKTVYEMMYQLGSTTMFNISRAATSSRPAMVNAFELYAEITAKGITFDELSIRSFADLLSSHESLNTFGDPCNPSPWSWLKCEDTFDARINQDVGYITEIDLSNQGLHGVFTADLQLPIQLKVFNLSNNQFSGLLPISLGKQLVTVDLSDNNFTGSIPTFPVRDSTYEVNVQSMDFLNLSSNYMFGDVINFSEGLVLLRILDLSENDFSGAFPAFPNASLEYLNLASNHMSGTISTILYSKKFELQPLRALILRENNFSGMVPDVIWGSLSQLQKVDLSYNNLEEINLTSWCQVLLKDESYQMRQQVNLLNNTIKSVVFSNLLSGLQSQPDSDIYKLLQRSGGYILLGGNEWCERVGLPEVRILERYLCRYSESEDYYWKYLEGTSNEHMIIGLSVSGSLVLLIACCLPILLARVWKKVKICHQIQEELAKEDVRPPFYKYEDIRTATRDFSQENELGKGGFGAVYKAELADRSIVAVKLLFPTEQNLTDFLKETVLITGIKHRNLVQLKGCCVKEKKRMLVYEYAQNGNLAQALWDKPFDTSPVLSPVKLYENESTTGIEGFKPFKKICKFSENTGKDGSSPLTWAQRLKICVGVAKGLSYLHEELQPKIIHRDIKPQNILLDKDLNAKIADFGLARPMKGDEGTQATRVGGTMGYLAPEYAVQGLITEKLDVYSYGILLLQIISGRKCFDSSATSDEFYLRTCAFKLYRVGCLLSIAEQNLLAVTSAEEIESVLKIALSCLQVVHNKRPSMSEVVTMLTCKSSSVAVEVVDQQILSDDSYEPF
ncbi:hypothetical protein R1sor_022150 [Riccia sorocarpa]|uniref:non-specific serine/threonine protein kinase n=1 Tax=Riccia sorocarpa TaxID=122646 RepID=A0ABD3GNA7_9MARC